MNVGAGGDTGWRLRFKRAALYWRQHVGCPKGRLEGLEDVF